MQFCSRDILLSVGNILFQYPFFWKLSLRVLPFLNSDPSEQHLTSILEDSPIFRRLALDAFFSIDIAPPDIISIF